MSHKDKMKLPKKQPKVRKSWGMLNPATRVVESEKKYKRSRERKIFRREVFDCMG